MHTFLKVPITALGRSKVIDFKTFTDTEWQTIWDAYIEAGFNPISMTSNGPYIYVMFKK